MTSIRKGIFTFLLAGFIPISQVIANSVSTESASPRLILQITVDQLRGDLMTRYYDRFS